MPDNAGQTGSQEGSQGGQQGQQGTQQTGSTETQQTQQGTQQTTPPPWERGGEKFDPERAWNLIQTLRTERDTIKTERDQLGQTAEQLRQQQMSEQERVVAQAKTEGRQAAIDELAPTLARTQFEALAARRNPGFDTTPALEFVDLKGFVVNGKPDVTKLQAAVERLVPAPTVGPPSFDGGARQGSTAPSNMNDFIRSRVS